MSEEKDTPMVINPKGEGEKHTPNTSEYSVPHPSDAEPEIHVDSMAFGENAEREPKYDVDHITDPGAIEMGQQTYDKHQEDK